LTGKISVTAVDDTLNEATETLTITLGTAPSTTGSIALGAARQASADLADNDPITVKIADESEDSDPDTGGVQVEEGESAVFRVTLDGAASGSAAVVTIPYTVGGDVSDNSGCLRGIADYRDSMSGTLSIPAETASATISIAALQDQCREPDETLTVTLGSAPSVAAGGGVIARSSVAGEQRASVVIPANANTVRDFSAIVADADATDRDSETDGVQVNEGGTASSIAAVAGSGPASGTAFIAADSSTIEERLASFAAPAGTSSVSVAGSDGSMLPAATTSGDITLEIVAGWVGGSAETLQVTLGAAVSTGAGAAAISLGAAQSASLSIPQNASTERSFSVTAEARPPQRRADRGVSYCTCG